MGKKRPTKKAARKRKPASSKATAVVAPEIPEGLRYRNRQLIRVRVSQLVDNPANHRTHPGKQQTALEAAVAEIGWFGYPDVFEHPEHPGQYMLVDGALRKAHLRRHYGEETEIEVNLTDFDEAEAAKALATKDAIGAMAGVERATLDQLLANLDPDSEAFEQLIQAMHESPEAEDPFTETETPDPSEELTARWQTEPGAVYEILGKAQHRLLVGDSTKPEDVERLLDGGSPFLMVTDPPYGVEYQPDWRHAAQLNNSKRVGVVVSDDRADWQAAYELFPGRVAYVWHAGRYAAEVILGLAAAGLMLRAQLVWRKPAIVIGRGHFHWAHEPCHFAVRGSGSVKWRGGTTESSVWEISNRIQDSEHKSTHGTQKPIECMGRPIRNHGDARDAVYDPFVGTGTTLVAAERLQRPSFAMEIAPEYAAVALERMSAEGCRVTRVE